MGFGATGRARTRARIRAGALFCGGVPVSVHGGPYSPGPSLRAYGKGRGEGGKG